WRGGGRGPAAPEGRAGCCTSARGFRSRRARSSLTSPAHLLSSFASARSRSPATQVHQRSARNHRPHQGVVLSCGDLPCLSGLRSRVGTRGLAAARTRASRSVANLRRQPADQPVTTHPSPSGPLIRLAAVNKTFGRRAVVDKVDLTVSRGELVEITGPSGAGKTTLLRLLHGQLRPTSGEVWVEGRALHRRWRHDLDRVRREVAFIFQEQRLLPRLTALENVVLGLTVNDPHNPPEEITKKATAALEALGV